MNEKLRAALARKIEAHNRLVRLGTIWSGLLVLLMWVVIYILGHWLLIFVSTLIHGLDAEPPRHFWLTFVVGAGVWISAAWVERHRLESESRRRSMSHGLIDLLFAPPRATLAVVANFNARVRFTNTELDRATLFLERIGRTGKLSFDSLETELPDEDTREHVLESLQSLELLCVRNAGGIEYLYPANPQSLIQFLR